MQSFNIKNNRDYKNQYINKNSKFQTGYYTVNEIKDLYPEGGIKVVGQLRYGDKEVGEIVNNNIKETVYKFKSSTRYKVIGYIELDDGNFIAVKKDNILMLILWFLLLALLLGGIIFGVYYGVTHREVKDNTPTTTAPNILDADAQLGVGELDLPSKLDTKNKSVAVSGIVGLNYKAGVTRQNTIFKNPEQNKDVCFMKFFVYLDNNEDGKIDEEDELLYESNLVQPGYAISKYDIKRPLNEGKYKAVVRTQPYAYDQERAELNRMDMPTIITVTKAEG